MKADFAALLGKKGGNEQVQKQLDIYTIPLEDNIKTTLNQIPTTFTCCLNLLYRVSNL